jgi:hypothetical protein
MAFRVPSFNLVCDIGLSTAAGYPGSKTGFIPRIVAQPCALVYGKRVNFAASHGPSAGNSQAFGMSLLLPALTDVRGLQSYTGNGNRVDLVECPSGSGRWYCVAWVEDIGKGWPNEHRVALIQVIGSFWTAPYP